MLCGYGAQCVYSSLGFNMEKENYNDLEVL